MPSILYEDNHLLALNKPAGWLVQGDKTGDPTLTDWGKAYLKEKYAKPGAVFLHPVHRIDRPVSGAVLFARTDKALSRLTTLFRDQKIQKTYIALTLNPPPAPQGECRDYLIKDERINQSRIVSVKEAGRLNAKLCITSYQLLEKRNGLYVLQLSPRTGRPHQIRVQLAGMGCVILGDLKYGAPSALPDASIGLHCRSMLFNHPVKGDSLLIEAAFPEQVWYQA